MPYAGACLILCRWRSAARGPPPPDDLLLRSALESGTTAYQGPAGLVMVNTAAIGGGTVRTSSGRMLGVLLVSDMPFMALHRETLQILGVLLPMRLSCGGCHHCQTSDSGVSDCPTVFGAELVKMTRLSATSIL